MEYNDELEDLVVMLDVDKSQYSDDEYEILEDLIKIEDEGIMDISHKLQQRDFDEYVSSLQKDTTILPQSFCRIKQNLKLLDRCRPLTIQVVDCKKFSKIFYNDKLAVDLKTRENLGDKFKEILCDKDNDISDHDTIEIGIDDDIEMDDLIRIDDVQENQHDVNDLSITQTIGIDVENINSTRAFEKDDLLRNYVTSELKRLSYDDSNNKLCCKSGNNNSGENLEVCKNFSSVSISTQQDSFIGRTNIPHYHARKEKKTELSTSKIQSLPKANDDNICKTNHKQVKKVNLLSFDIITNDSFLINPQRIANHNAYYDFSKSMRNENKVTKNHIMSETSTQTKDKYRLRNKSMGPAKKKDKNTNKYSKSIQLNIEMQKKIEDMLVTVKELKRSYSKKTSRKPSDVSVMFSKSERYQPQGNNTKVTTNYTPQHIHWNHNNFNNCHWHHNNFINSQYPIYNTEVNYPIFSNLLPANYTNLHMPNQQNHNINKTFTFPPIQYSPKIHNQCYDIHNYNIKKNANNNLGKRSQSKSLSSVNFMKTHLQKLAKANDNPNNIKKRPIYNYGLSHNMKQKDIEKTYTFKSVLDNEIKNISEHVKSCYQDKDFKNVIKGNKYISYKSNLTNRSVVVNKHPMILNILQNGIAVTKSDTKTPSTPIDKINLEPITIGGCKDDIFACFRNNKESNEIQQNNLVLHNEMPQQISTLHCTRVEPVKLISNRDQGLTGYISRESSMQNVTEPWQIPLMKRKEQESYQIPAKIKKIEVDSHKSYLQQEYFEYGKDTLMTIENPIQVVDGKIDMKATKEVDHMKLMLPSIKLSEKSKCLGNNTISTYKSPVQCMQVELHQSPPKTSKIHIRKEEEEIEKKNTEVGQVKPTPSAKLAVPNLSKLQDPKPLKYVKNVDKSVKPTVNANRTAAMAKVSTMVYSPPVLPIPSFKKTFEIMNKLNLISKYTYRRNRNAFKYSAVDPNKILLNRSITKDLEIY